MPITNAEVLRRCRWILDNERKKDSSVPEFDSINFLEGANIVADILKSWAQAKRPKHYRWMADFVPGLRTLRDDFETQVARDPACLYVPAHEVALAFHSSNAKVRANFSANRTSKTQSGVMEQYWVATGQHPYRPFNPPPTASFVIGVNFSKYAPAVFEKKFVSGEPGNPLSPLFPEGGKWFHHYNDRKHIITLCCPECAIADRASTCPHAKSTITLFSDMEGPDVLQGGQYNLGGFDEHIREDFFDEAMERLKTVPNSSLVITETPLLGKQAWEYRRLVQLYLKGPTVNRMPGTDVPYVSIHTIDQYAAGLVDVSAIEASKLTMDPIAQEARIYGRFAPFAEHAVFDRYALHEMEDDIIEPKRYEIISEDWQKDFELHETPDGMLRIWEEPDDEKSYIMGCDVAAGLTGRDFSCASVISVPDFRMVAQLHGWINPLDYAVKVAQLGAAYGMALAVVERTGGFGSASIMRMMELGYYNLFRDLTEPTQAEHSMDAVYGVDTNIRTKAHMVSALQQVIRERQIKVYCGETLEELMAYGQEYLPQNIRFGGAKGANDDRVMSIVVAVYVAVTYSIFNFRSHQETLKKARRPEFWRDVDKAIEEKNKPAKDWYQ